MIGRKVGVEEERRGRRGITGNLGSCGDEDLLKWTAFPFWGHAYNLYTLVTLTDIDIIILAIYILGCKNGNSQDYFSLPLVYYPLGALHQFHLPTPLRKSHLLGSLFFFSSFCVIGRTADKLLK